MPKITFIGAGSTVFTKNLLGDILSFPSLADSTISLHDINPDRLRTSEIVAHKVMRSLGVDAKIESTTDRRAALAGADFVICTIQVGGYEPATVIDFEIPKKYGLRQTIGDTLGIGGIMRGLRTIPVLLDITRDMEELCPQSVLLNFVNPMAILCWALNEATPIRTIGLCHSVQNTIAELSSDLNIPEDEIDYLAAGINHMAFFLKLERLGEDLYPHLREFMANERRPTRPELGMVDHVRYEMLKRLGYFVTESSEHFSEYVPWFIKNDRPGLIDQFDIPLDEYLRRCKVQIAEWESLRQEYEADDTPITIERSREYGSLIIESMVSGTPRVVYANVANQGLIDNLPDDCCVEVPCLVDRYGIQPTRIGTLPSHLAALMQTNINAQRLTVEAALTQKRETIYHAAMLDPHTAAELSLDEIWKMVDELIEAHEEWLPSYHSNRIYWTTKTNK